MEPVAADRFQKCSERLVGIQIRRGTTIFQIPAFRRSRSRRNENGRAAIRDAPPELFDTARLVLAGETIVIARTVPIALHRLRIELGVQSVSLSQPIQQPAYDPELTRDLERRQLAHLELPMRGHHLGIGAMDSKQLSLLDF